MRSLSLTALLLVGTLLLVAANAPPALSDEEVHPDLQFQAKTPGGPWAGPLMPLFEEAAARHDVPLPLLLTLAYFGSAFENRGDAPTIEGGYGIMALRDRNAWGSDSLGEGAELVKIPRGQLKTHPAGNINAAAAVLSAYAHKMHIDRSKGLDAWLEPVIKYAGLDEENSRFFAAEVYEKLLTGLDWTNSSGERFYFPPQDIGDIDLSDLFPKEGAVSPGQGDGEALTPSGLDAGLGFLSTDYGPAIWDPAASCNYSTSQYNKDTIVIHTIEGTAAGARSWFKNCSASVSAHYVVSEAGGVWQCVREIYTAWHAGCVNYRSIGIEHEGYASSSSHPKSLYDASGLLSRDICNDWGIPKEHRSCCPGILGHKDVNDCHCGGTHWDPGSGWDWNYYIQVVKGSSTPTWAATYNAQSYPSTMVADSTAIAWVEFVNNGTGTWTHSNTRLGTSSPQDRTSPFCNTSNWISCNRPTDVDQSSVSTGQVGRFTFILKAPSTPGTYTEKYRLVQEGVTWFGPEITWTITVTAATGSITGTVTNANTGAAISGATVAVTGGPTTTTNSSGVYTISGLNAGTYTVTVSKSGYTSKSASVSVTAGQTTTKNFALTPSDTTPPSVPTNLVARATAPTRISLTWTASTDDVGVAGYKVYRGGSYLASVTTASYTDTACSASSSYTYTVSAYDASGNESAQSSSASATTPPSEIIIDNTACELTGSWTTGTSSTDKYGADYLYGSTGETETRSAIWRPNLSFGGTYDIYCWYPQGSNRAANSPYVVVYYGGQQTISVNQQTNGGKWNLLRAGNVFATGTSGYVKLHNGTGSTGYIVVADAIRLVTISVDTGPDTIAPSVPTNLRATVVAPTQVDLTWTASTDNVGVVGYKIYRNGSYLATKPGGPSYSDTTIVANVTYTYTVSAYDAANNESAQSAPAVTSGMNEFRAFWVDAWGSGYENPTATTTMLDYVQSCNANAVFVEMRKRGDAYYTSSYEPTGTNITPESGYDCLADIVTKGHDRNLEVHAWVVVNRVWTSQTAPPHTTPDHVFNTHPEWFSLSSTGSMFSGDDSWLDPGHPDVENYHKNVFMEIVQNYDIDGLVLDYIRYPGTSFGYNATAVARYNAEYGTSGNPSTSDLRWSNWRRDQVTNMVKRIYLEAKAVKPGIKIGAAVWSPAGAGYSGYLQDWDSWMANHWLDYVCPMNYTTDNATFEGENEDSLNRQYGRHIYPAQGSYLNTISNSMTQISSVQSLGFPGVTLYTYRVTNSGTVDRPAFRNALIASDGPFSGTRSVTPMYWINAPTTGMLKGFIKTSGGAAIYPATVTVQGKSTKNSGTGFYGFVDLTPGTYTVTASAPGYSSNSGQVTITAGTVATLDIVLATDTTAPTISNVGTKNVWGTNVQIVWDTNEPATSQVEYGLTQSYGSQTPEDVQLVTDHTVQLVGLTQNTTYHFRVKSRDGAGNLATSGDYVFTTIGNDVVQDIIIDNPQCTLVGSWFTGTSSTDKYGSDYYYCTTQPSEDKTATWRPNIIVAGNYDIYVWYPQGTNRSQMAPYTCVYNGGSQVHTVNQQTNGGRWNLIGRHAFATGTGGYIRLGNGTGESSLNVMADAVKLSYADTTPPSAPTNLTVSAVSETQANLSWTASTDNIGVAGYKIFRDGTQIGISATTSYSDTTCSAGIRYVFEVSAYDAAGNESEKSVPADIVMPGGDRIPPSVPEIVMADGKSPSQIDLAWTTSTDNVEVTGYKVYRNGVQVGTTDKTSYSDTGLAELTTYTYEVSAYDAAGNESAKSTPKEGTTLDGTPPSVPTGLTGTAVSESRIDLSWTASTDNAGVTNYRVYRNGVEIAFPLTNSYSDTNCVPSTTYTYEVAAEDAAHNLSAKSSPAVVTSLADSTPPSVPTNLTTTAVSRSQINLSWTASTDNVGVAGYKIYRDGSQIGTSTTTSYSDTTCWGNTTYTYKVSAYDARGNESAQSAASVRTTPAVTDIVMDNNLAVYVGSWTSGTSATDKYGSDYFYGSTAATETRSATWTPPIDVSGYYTVYCWYPQGSNRATNAPYVVTWYNGSQTVEVNQQANGGGWRTLVTGKVYMKGTSGSVKLHNGTGSTGYIVVADAVRFYMTSSDLTPPSTPTNLTATAVSTSQINLSWTASTDNVGVTGYKIFRNGSYLTSVTGTSYSNTGLSPVTTYSYKVSAYDAAGNESGQSNQAVATTWESQVIVDNSDAGFSASANWSTGTSASDKYGANYRWRPTAATSDQAVWSFNLVGQGSFAVYAWWTAGTNRASQAPYVVYYSGGNTTVKVNQQSNGGKWNLLTTKTFAAGSNHVNLSCWTTTGYIVVADAIKLVRQ